MQRKNVVITIAHDLYGKMKPNKLDIFIFLKCNKKNLVKFVEIVILD